MQVRNIVTISLMIFIIIVVVILGASVFINQNKPSQQIDTVINPPKNNPAPNDATPTGGTTTPPVTTSITATEIAKHSTASDCWVIISSKIYNVTNYIPLHPAGPDKIIPYCGKDSTVAFNTKGGKGSHSQKAQDALNTYYVGNLR